MTYKTMGDSFEGNTRSGNVVMMALLEGKPRTHIRV